MKSSANDRGSLVGGGPWRPSLSSPAPPPSSPPASSPDLWLTCSPWKLLLLTVRTCLLKSFDLISSLQLRQTLPVSLQPLLLEAAPGSAPGSAAGSEGGGASEACLGQATCSSAAKLAACESNDGHVDNVASFRSDPHLSLGLVHSASHSVEAPHEYVMSEGVYTTLDCTAHSWPLVGSGCVYLTQHNTTHHFLIFLTGSLAH